MLSTNSLKDKVKNLDNYLVISNKKYPDIVSQFVLENTPIKIFKLIEKINIEFLKMLSMFFFKSLRISL